MPGVRPCPPCEGGASRRQESGMNMSVKVNDRNESTQQFLDTAVMLHIHTLKTCRKMSAKDQRMIGDRLAQTAADIVAEIKRGNSIYPMSPVEYQERRLHFLNAYGGVQALITLVSDAKEVFPITNTATAEWGRLAHWELSLLKGVIETDKGRYGKRYPLSDVTLP